MKIIAIITAITFLMLSCSDKENGAIPKENRVTVQTTFDNGQPKNTTYKTIDNKNTYYEIEYDSLGRIRQIIPYSNGKKNGSQIYLRDDLNVGALRANKNDNRHGFSYEFYEDLQTAFKGEALDDKFNGLSTWFYRDGKPEYTGIRVNGEQEGEWVEFYENGHMKSQGTYTNGTKNDDWTYFNLDGTADSSKTE